MNKHDVIGESILKKLSKLLFDSFDKLVKYGFDIEDVDKSEDKNGRSIINMKATTGGGHNLRIRLISLNGKDRWDMIIKSDDGKHDILENVRDADIDKKLTSLIDDWYGETYEGLEEDIEESSNIKFTLRRIECDNYIELQLKSIYCNEHNYTEAHAILNDMLEDEEFVNSIPEDFTCYEARPTVDSIEIAEVDCPDVDCNCFKIMMSAFLNALLDIKTIQWNCPNMLLNCIENKIWSFSSIIDVLAGLSYEKFGYSPDIHDLIDCSKSMCIENLANLESLISILKKDADELLDVIDLFYDTLDSDIQIIVDGWLREIKDYRYNNLCRFDTKLTQ